MKILLVTHIYPTYQGQNVRKTSYALHQFVKHWVKVHEVMVLKPINWPARAARSQMMGLQHIDAVPVRTVPAYRIPFTKKVFLDASARRMAESVESPPDVVVSHSTKALFMGHRLARRFGCPHICGLHFVDVEYLGRGELLKDYRQVLDACAAIGCRSPSIQNGLNDLSRAWYEKSFLVNSGIESEAIIDRGVMLKKLKRWKRGATLQITTAAKLRKLKNIDIVLQALAALRAEVDWRYTIIGDGEEAARLKELAEQLGIADRVHFTGLLMREEVLDRLRSSHIFVMVSAPETFGLAYLEAMAAGNIVIGSKGYGIDGIVRDGQNGFLCTPKDEQDLIRAIRHLALEMPEEQVEQIASRSWETANDLTDRRVAEEYLTRIEDTVRKAKSEAQTAGSIGGHPL